MTKFTQEDSNSLPIDRNSLKVYLNGNYSGIEAFGISGIFGEKPAFARSTISGELCRPTDKYSFG